MANTFKNKVVFVGTLVDIDLKIEDYNRKDTGEPYQAIVGNYTIDTGGQAVNLRAFIQDTFRSGKANRAFGTAMRWIEDPESYKGRSYKIDTNIGDNSFIPDGQTDVVQQTAIQSGFIDDRNVGLPRAEFTEDVLILTDPVELYNKDDEPTGKFRLDATIFDYMDVAFPASFIIEAKEAVAYFENLGASRENPVLIEVWGKVINNLIEREIVTESAFGEPNIEIQTTSRRENIITGAAMEPKEITDEVAKVIMDGKAAYEAKIAELKDSKKQSGFGGASATTSAATGGAKPASGTFNF